MKQKISFSDISFSMLSIIGILPMVLAAVIAFTTIKIQGQTMRTEIENVKTEMKDTIQRRMEDHEKLIIIDTNTGNLKESFGEFKVKYESDMREIKQLLRELP